jgi:hypothetical protein
VHFHPRLIELCSHYQFQPRPCAPGKGNQNGKVERAIRYVRESFFEATRFTTLEDLNGRAWAWRDQVAHQSPWPDDAKRAVGDVFAEEEPRLLPLPAHRFLAELVRPVRQRKGIWVPFDLNHYSIPPDAVGLQLTLVASATTVRILNGQQEAFPTVAATTATSTSRSLAMATRGRCSSTNARPGGRHLPGA